MNEIPDDDDDFTWTDDDEGLDTATYDSDTDDYSHDPTPTVMNLNRRFVPPKAGIRSLKRNCRSSSKASRPCNSNWKN